ncbi:hypothetical protein KEM56_006943 [Ascosphaera pollenicola]|nr:hypothetical protein KEM56_006943 [Ascosphaera pollenicola]
MAMTSSHSLTSAVGRPTQSLYFDGSIPIPTHARSSSDGFDPEDNDPYRIYRPVSHKAMLEKALSRAQAAVVLDRHRNYEGAIDAYRHTCSLLQQIINRSDLGEEKHELDEIFDLYSQRISVLEQTDYDTMPFDANLLPAPPTTGSFLSDILSECGSEEVSKLDFSEELLSTSQSTNHSAEGISSITAQTRRRSPRPTSYSHIPPRRTSLLSSSVPGLDSTGGRPVQPLAPPRLPSRSGSRRHTPNSSLTSQSDLRSVDDYAPSDQFLSHARFSPQPPLSPCSIASSRASTHRRGKSNDSISWLGTIDEMAGPEAVSHYSSGSIVDQYAGHYSDAATTSLDFDDALDAAVDAAYDDRPDHTDYYNDNPEHVRHDRCGKVVSGGVGAGDAAIERARGGHMDSGPLAEDMSDWTKRLTSDFWNHDSLDLLTINGYVANNKSNGEEESSHDFKFDFASQSSDAPSIEKRSTPSSSGKGGSTSTGIAPDIHVPQSAGSTALPTVTEDTETESSQLGKQQERTCSPTSKHSFPQITLGPAPTEALPPVPSATPSLSSSFFSPPPTPPPQAFAATSSNEAGLRSRRFKGNATRLSINVQASTDNENNSATSGALFSPFPPSTLPPPQVTTSLSAPNSPRQTGQSSTGSQAAIDTTDASTKAVTPRTSVQLDGTKHKGSSIFNSSARASPVLPGAPSPSLTRPTTRSSDDVAPETFRSPSQLTNSTITAPETNGQATKFVKQKPLEQPKLKKNVSSSSLRSLKGLRNRGLSFSGNNDHANSYFTPASPITEDNPLNRFALERKHSVFTTTSQQTLPSTPTSIAPPTANPRPSLPGTTSIYEMALQDPIVHDAWDSDAIDAPYPLEACPQTALLRPYWLMRCLYQTIAHPRGGYLTTKLFIPKVVWQVNNVKLKAVPDKINCCNQLTAALHKLAAVDMNDADAVNSEMQTLEGLLDQLQNTLSKKLGNEVGAHGAAALFKPHGGEEAAGASSVHGDAYSFKSASSKSYFTPWRKLRSKSSGTSGAAGIESVPSKDIPRDGLMMSTLPMMDSISLRSAKRYPAQIQYSGPNSAYMSAVARVCDAAQILDQIARQFGDPGIRSSSKAHVGLVLGSNRVSDFFAYYICRFVLNDVGLLLDKYLKRAAEWLMA